MTVRIMRFTKLLLGLGLAACAWPLSGQNARQEIYADPDKAGGVYYAYTYDNPARTPAPEGYEPFYISHYGRHGSRWLLRASEYTEVLETFGKAAREGAPYSLVSYIHCPYLCVRVEWALFSFSPLEFRPLRFLFGRNGRYV